jgi:hypothetical protein
MEAYIEVNDKSLDVTYRVWDDIEILKIKEDSKDITNDCYNNDNLMEDIYNAVTIEACNPDYYGTERGFM